MAQRKLFGLAIASLGRCRGVRVTSPAVLSSRWLPLPRSNARWASTSKEQEISFTASENGQPGTDGYFVSFKDMSGKNISPWHDIPLENGHFYNFICEVCLINDNISRLIRVCIHTYIHTYIHAYIHR